MLVSLWGRDIWGSLHFGTTPSDELAMVNLLEEKAVSLKQRLYACVLLMTPCEVRLAIPLTAEILIEEEATCRL